MLLKLCALVLGDGAVVAVALDDDASVGELRQALCREQQYAFPASKLLLFEARALTDDPDADFRGWLRAADPLVRALKKGAAPPAQLLHEDLEMDPTFPLSDYFAGDRAPQLKEIHVLVQLPGAAPAAASVPMAREAVVPATPEPTLSTHSPAAAVAAPLVAVATPAPPAAAVQVQRTLQLTPTPTRRPTPAQPVAPVAVATEERRDQTQRAARLSTTPTLTPSAPPPPSAAPARVILSPTGAVVQSSSTSASTPGGTAAPASTSQLRTIISTLSGVQGAETPAAKKAASKPAVDPVRVLNAELRASLLPVPDIPKQKRGVGRPRLATISRPSSTGSDRTRRAPSASREARELPAGVRQSTGASSVSIRNIISSSGHTNASRKLNISTWSYKASALFFYFHPELGNRNFAHTCDAFGIIGGTFRNWVTKSEFFGKWVPLVQSMTLRDAMANVPDEVLANFQVSELHPDAKVTLPERYTNAVKAQTGLKRLQSDLQAWSIESQAVWGQTKRLRSDVSAVGSAKTVGSGRIPKYQDEEAFLLRQVRVAWETGEALTTAKMYNLLREAFAPPPRSPPPLPSTVDGDASSPTVPATSGTESEGYELSPFAQQMKLDQKQASAALSQWTGRRLESNHWVVHSRQVAPKVPTNWYDAALQTSTDLRELMRDVDVLISADELFVDFYSRAANGAGEADAGRDAARDALLEKTGCTVVLGCELFSSTVLPPFTIMAGVHECGRGSNDEADNSSNESSSALSRRFDPLVAADARRGGAVRDALPDGRERPPPVHWMDVHAAKQYVAFLAGLYPDKQIGLIWDTASSHVDEEVREYIAEQGMVVGFVPPGLSSVMQVCDRVFGAKRVIQNSVQEKFEAWKFAEQAKGPMLRFEFGMIHPVERSRVLQWIDDAVARLRETCGDTGVKRAFRALGQDPRSAGEVESEFREHLRSLNDETIAPTLTETQLALRLE